MSKIIINNEKDTKEYLKNYTTTMSKHRIPHEKWMEFVSEIATQLTELNFQEDTFDMNVERNEQGQTVHRIVRFTEDAQEFFNERYDEVETLLENMLDITNDKPEYYEG
tara:strand:+ start:971 stop:1297 length:327 start_codon:yes stop_codon:yes gene_type:complete